MSVFESYADFYDLLYQDKDYAGEAKFVASLLAPHGVRTVLDLGCGTGQHAWQLAKLGYSVVGVDRSERMLSRARERCAVLDEEMRPRFVAADACAYRDGDTYDAAISLFHVASYQTTENDLARFFAAVARHLVQGGPFIFDVWHSPALRVQPPQVRVKRASDATGSVVRISEPTADPQSGLVSVHFTTFARRASEETWTQSTETHVMRPFDIPTIRAQLERAGFELLAVHEGYSNAPITDRSFNVLIVASLARPAPRDPA